MSRNPEAVGVQQLARRYRYRTTALVGSWRSSREAAVEDAINAKQAAREDEVPSGFKWVVPGEIEEEGA